MMKGGMKCTDGTRGMEPSDEGGRASTRENALGGKKGERIQCLERSLRCWSGS